MHWSRRWIGRPYVAGRYECTDFVEEVLAAEFGHSLALPRADGVRARDRLIAALTGDYARPPDRPPEEGDGVLLQAAGRRGVGQHIGLWCAPAGVPSVLHCESGMGGIVHALARLRGLEVVGIYAWRR